MVHNNKFRKLRRYSFWFLFWISPIVLVLCVFGSITGYADILPFATNSWSSNQQTLAGEWQRVSLGNPSAISTQSGQVINSGVITVNQQISPTVTSTYTVTSSFVPGTIEISFTVDHPAPAELDFVLITPLGQQLPLPELESKAAGNVTWNLILQEGQNSDVQGLWQFAVSDTITNSSAGTLETWQLIIEPQVTIFQTFLPLVFGPIVNPPQPPTSTPTFTPTPTQTPTSTPFGVPPGFGTSTPTPTQTSTPGPPGKPTLTPTSTATPTPELVDAGDFEGGRDRWTTFSLKDYELFFDVDDDSVPNAPVDAVSGSYLVWLGGDDNEISYIERKFTIPDDRDFLGHFVRRQSYDSVCASDLYNDVQLAGLLRYATLGLINDFGVDLGGVLICQNTSGTSGCGDNVVTRVEVSGYDLCAVPDSSSWVVFLVPIDNFRGSEATIQIKAITDSQLSSSVFVDDVAWYGSQIVTGAGGLTFLSEEDVQRIPEGVEVHILEPVTAPSGPPVQPQIRPDKAFIIGQQAAELFRKNR